MLISSRTSPATRNNKLLGAVKPRCRPIATSRPGNTASTTRPAPSVNHKTAYFSRSWRRRSIPTIEITVAIAPIRATICTVIGAPLSADRRRVGPSPDQGEAQGQASPAQVDRRPPRRLARDTIGARTHGDRYLGDPAPCPVGDD